MKKLVWIIILLFSVLSGMTNPLPSPYFVIREFYIVDQNNWTLEVQVFFGAWYDVDTLYFQSNAGISYINDSILNTSEDIIIFTNDDLAQPVPVNPQGDVIKIFCPWYYFEPTQEIRYGNVPDPLVYSPVGSQSISGYGFVQGWDILSATFSLDNTPTPGLIDLDTTGVCGTMNGTVFDIDDQPVADQIFVADFPFTTDSEGHYTTRIYSRFVNVEELMYERMPNGFSFVPIEPVQYGMKPDSVITRNIYLLDTLHVGIEKPAVETSIFLNIFPNPAKDQLCISYSSELSTETQMLELTIFNAEGRKITSYPLTDRLGVSRFPINLPNGTYVACLSSPEKNLATKKFLVKR